MNSEGILEYMKIMTILNTQYCFQINAAAAAKSLQSCLTLCDPMDCSPPGSSVHGILQARRLEWVAMPSSRASSQPRDWTQVSCFAGRFFTAETQGKPSRLLASCILGLLMILMQETARWSHCMYVKVTQSCLILCDPMDYTVNGILQTRILE